VDNYARGNDFATIQNNRPKGFLVKSFSGNYFRGSDSPTIKNFRQKKFLSQNF
jgi:hypothetical protein